MNKRKNLDIDLVGIPKKGAQQKVQGNFPHYIMMPLDAFIREVEQMNWEDAAITAIYLKRMYTIYEKSITTGIQKKYEITRCRDIAKFFRKFIAQQRKIHHIKNDDDFWILVSSLETMIHDLETYTDDETMLMENEFLGWKDQYFNEQNEEKK